MKLGLLKKKNPVTSSQGVLEKGWNCLRETLEAFWKKRIIVILLLIIAFTAFSCYHFSQSLRTATTVVSLDYEEASKGLTPSHTRFNIFEIQSTDVMKRAIEYAGLEGVIEPEELSKCIKVKATHNKNVSGKENFISTSYNVTFTFSDEIKERSVETMLSLLCKSYREFFVENYGINHSILSFDINDLKFNDEYLMTVDLLELKCNQLEKYVQLRKRENKNYQDPETGITFSALEQRAKNFYTYDLARLRSYIIESGIANDKTSLNAILNYKIRMDRLIYNKLIAAYEEDNDGIKMYDTAMSAIVMIPTEDSSEKYYMSRTKTGMDNMALNADEKLNSATKKTTAISTDTYLIKKMRLATPSAGQIRKADDMIRKMKASLEELASDIRKTDKVYASYKARNYLSFRSTYQSFRDRIDIVSSVFGTAVLIFMTFIAVFVRKFVVVRK